MPECQARAEHLEKNEVWRVQPFVTHYRWIIYECGVRKCIGGRHWHSRIRCDPERRRSLRICCDPVRRQHRGRHTIEVFDCCLQRTRRALHGNWRNSSEYIDSSPASNVVWWARRPALLVGDKMSRVIQRCPTSGNVVTQIWSGTPQQRHCASNMRGRHGRAAKTHVSIVGGVIAGTSACARRGDIRFDSVTPIDRHRAAAAKGSNDVLARVQRPDRVRCRIDRWRIHHGGTGRTVVACSCHHHNSGGGLSFDSSLQRVSRTTF